MTILVTCPENCRAERSWACAVILGEFLGLSFELRFHGGATVYLSAGGKSLELSDAFFSKAKDHWLDATSLPDEPLRHWAAADIPLDAVLAGSTVPVLYGEATYVTDGAGNAKVGLDILGSAFFMLSRYEEAAGDAAGGAAGPQRDRHDRFPAAASVAYRAGFLGRPLVDEYVEILWAAMVRLWPNLRRRQRSFRTVVTCDVDHPYHRSARSIVRLVKRTVGETVRKRRFPDAVRPLRNFLASRKGNWRNDPYYHTVDWMMDVNERAGNRMAFYFIPEITDAAMDDTCLPGDPAVNAMMCRIAGRGHEIGIHPGYRTYRSRERTLSGLHALRRALERERIAQPVAGGRQHYLRWSTHTPAIWDSVGLSYDSTLSYPEHAGFRCGTCHEYPMFDLHRRQALGLRQRPLICMDCTVTASMGYGMTAAALEKMTELKGVARLFGGSFTLLWHNSYLESEQARTIYGEVIAQ
jgi:hypothetical protein